MASSLALRLAMPMGSHTGGGPHPVAPWLLQTGVWNNAGVWLDSATWTEWLLNGGTWSDIGVWADTLTWPTPSGPYVAGAVIFDPNGDGDCRLEASDFISPNTPYCSWAGWCFIPAASFDNGAPTFVNNLGNFYEFPGVIWNIAGDAYLDAKNGLGDRYIPVTAGAVIPADTWLWLAGNIDVNHDAGSRTYQYYIGDNAQVLDPSNGGHDDGLAFNILFSEGNPALLRSNGEIIHYSDVFVWPGQLIDWSDVSNRRLLYSASGKPVSPAAAIAAFGTPAMGFSGDATTFIVNEGPVSFTHTLGTITNAPSSPSD